MHILSVILMLNFNSIMPQTPVRYVALGDSYTIGTGATETQTWPTVLCKHLKESGIPIQLIANPAHNGWTTADVIEKELPVLDQSKATFVSLLIGVNDWVRGVEISTFKYNLIVILDHIQKVLPDKQNIVLITIPDCGVTPTGAQYSNGRNISQGIQSFNEIIRAEARNRGLPIAELFEVSKEMGKNADLIAPDGLHPSAKGYASWEQQIYPVVYKVLKTK
ncbi:MAG TPA: SGNH/GDSL hydrolase family protein [Bacteroidia bacterium]|nr:SGNH/GDSL hydrolase family protein [Bacteroidia bacterium]